MKKEKITHMNIYNKLAIQIVTQQYSTYMEGARWEEWLESSMLISVIELYEIKLDNRSSFCALIQEGLK